MIRLLVILSAAVGASIDHPADGQAVVYRCDFDEAADANFDRWPDGWTRQTGRDYPAYVRIGIDGELSGDRSLRIDLDGGAGAAYSPAIPVIPSFNYVLRGRVRTSRLEHDAACITLTFFDAQHNPIGATLCSPEVRQADEWRELRIDVATPDDDRIVQAVIGLHLRPGKKADLVGSAEFAEIALGRLPKLELRGGAPFHIFHAAGDVAIDCSVSGVSSEESKLKLELFDVDNHLLVAETLDVQGRRLAGASTLVGDAQPAPGLSRELPAAYVGGVTWRPAVPDFGFYRVRAVLEDGSDARLANETTLVVMRPIPSAVDGPFGWSLSHEHRSASLEQLATLLPSVGIHWLKFPLWRAPNALAMQPDAVAKQPQTNAKHPPAKANASSTAPAKNATALSTGAARDGENWPDRFSRFCERLAMDNIEVVAVLDQPPAELRERFPDSGPLPVAAVFLDPEMWSEAIDPVAANYSLKIRWWQLGSEDDSSFVGIPKLADTIAGIQARMQRFGQQVQLGFAIGWSAPPRAAIADRLPWAFLSLDDDPSVPVDALEARLASRPEVGVERWFTLRPSIDAAHDVETRARMLIQRMLAARIAGVQRIFFGDPFDPEHGLFDAANLPREMLLPWRTTAEFLSGSEFLGSITLPSGSRNYVFVRGEQAMMIVWNDHPTTEALYLGEQIEQVDPWGRGKTLPSDEHGQIVPVGPTPTFLLGLSLPVARWRMSAQFENDRLESIFGRGQTAGYSFHNTFDRAVAGSVELRVPDVWQIEPRRAKFALDVDGDQKNTFDVFLDADASSGPQPVRLDFIVEADREYKFSVYRTVQVGLGDVEIELSCRLDERGALVVKQRFMNHTDREVNFNCMLFAPGRRRDRIQVLRQGRGESVGTFVLDRGEELIGHTLWLRAEEIGGDRILNYSIVAEK